MVIQHIPGIDFDLISNSGQCFRMMREQDGAFSLIAFGQHLRIAPLGEDRYQFDCDEAAFESLWRGYFDLDRDYQAVLRSIPEEDSFLSAAGRYGAGLRILRQEPWETLVSFIISQRKNMPAIRRCVAGLARYGQPIGEGRYAFPSAEALAGQSLTHMDACGLGYRSRYILFAARAVAEGRLDLEAIARLDDAALLAALCELQGVGEKVASCVMLFAYGRADAFPRDVWINRVIDAEYGGHFPLERYRGHAGILQQMMFCYARSAAYAAMQKYKGKTVILSEGR